MVEVNAAIKGEAIATITFIWMQGEADARLKYGDVYGASLKGLYEQLSDDMGRTDINFIIGRISDFDLNDQNYPDWSKVREAQVKFAESCTRCSWVDTDDLNDGVNKKGEQVLNGLHYTVEGYKLLGIRFAEEAIELIHNNKE